MSEIRSGDVIKHEKAMDVCFVVYKAIEKRCGFQLHGWWMNMGYTKSWIITGDELFVKTEDIPKWSVCIDKGSNPCIRYCTWVSLAS